jgi:subtilisin family serine protease
MKCKHTLIASFVSCLSWLLLAGQVCAEPIAIPGEFIIVEHHPAPIMKIRDVETIEAAVGKQVAITDASAIGVKISTDAAWSKHAQDVDVCSIVRSHHRQQRKNNPQKIIRRVPCERNYAVAASIVPNDPYWSVMWDMQRLNMTSVWDKSTGSNSVIVAVVDTGVDYNHPDLASNIWRNTREIAGNGIDDDGNGYVDDIYGANFITGSGDPMDDNGHGTHCSGTIGARGNNSTGIAGVNWNVKIMGLKFLSASGSGSTWGALNALTYGRTMKERGENIVLSSNSWGGGGYSSALATEIERWRIADMLVVVAAGNSSSNNDAAPSYPASYPSDNIISVAAIASDGSLASFSNYGASSVDIGAPGVQIPSTYPSNRYVYLSGTSMACPHVSGAAALLKAYSGNLSSAAIKAALLNGARGNPNLSGKTLTGGELDTLGAMSLVPDSPYNPTPAPSPTPTLTPTMTPTATPTPVPPTPTPTATPVAGSLVLRVIADTGLGMSQVQVTVSGPKAFTYTGQTAADGRLTVGTVAGGLYTVQFTKSGYSFGATSFQVYVNGNTSYVVSAIRNTYTVQVYALDKVTAAPIPGATVILYINGSLSQTATVQPDGSVSAMIPFGAEYRFVCSADNYYTKEVSGSVTGSVKRIASMM